MKNTKIVGIIAVILMLFSMVLYVVSDDEAIPPVENPTLGDPSLEMPAAE